MALCPDTCDADCCMLQTKVLAYKYCVECKFRLAPSNQTYCEHCYAQVRERSAFVLGSPVERARSRSCAPLLQMLSRDDSPVVKMLAASAGSAGGAKS